MKLYEQSFEMTKRIQGDEADHPSISSSLYQLERLA